MVHALIIGSRATAARFTALSTRKVFFEKFQKMNVNDVGILRGSFLYPKKIVKWKTHSKGVLIRGYVSDSHVKVTMFEMALILMTLEPFHKKKSRIRNYVDVSNRQIFGIRPVSRGCRIKSV